MNNKIPKEATKLEVTFLKETSAGKENTKMIAEKTECGWIGTDKNGEKWQLFTSHLRNRNYCNIRVLETEE